IMSGSSSGLQKASSDLAPIIVNPSGGRYAFADCRTFANAQHLRSDRKRPPGSRERRRAGEPARCAAQRARVAREAFRLRARAVWRLHGAGRRRVGFCVHAPRLDASRQADHHGRGPGPIRRPRSAAAGVPRRAGGPMWFLSERDSRLRQGAARPQSGAEPRRDRGGARQEPVSLRRAQPHHPRGAARRIGKERSGGMSALPRSLADNPRLDRWIGFEPDRTVRLATGKVELGPGVLTALTQIAADELDVEPERVRILSGDTERTPNEGYTTGSMSIEISGGSIRLVCAEVRRLFVEKLAVELGCDPAELTVVGGKFLRGQTDTGYDYWRLAPGIDLARDAKGSAPVKHPSEHHVIGRDFARLDLPDKLAGAPFLHDLAPERMLHARVLRQPRRGARLVSLDEAAARRAGAAEIVREGDFICFV